MERLLVRLVAAGEWSSCAVDSIGHIHSGRFPVLPVTLSDCHLQRLEIRRQHSIFKWTITFLIGWLFVSLMWPRMKNKENRVSNSPHVLQSYLIIGYLALMRVYLGSVNMASISSAVMLCTHEYQPWQPGSLRLSKYWPITNTATMSTRKFKRKPMQI